MRAEVKWDENGITAVSVIVPKQRVANRHGFMVDKRKKGIPIASEEILAGRLIHIHDSVILLAVSPWLGLRPTTRLEIACGSF